MLNFHRMAVKLYASVQNLIVNRICLLLSRQQMNKSKKLHKNRFDAHAHTHARIKHAHTCNLAALSMSTHTRHDCQQRTYLCNGA